jgi:hypothetical protein
MVKRTMMAQLASVSEGALGKLASSGVTKSALEGAFVLKERVERLMKGMAELDDRVDVLEKRVSALEKPKPRTPAKRAPAKKPSATTAKKATSTAAKPRSSANKTAAS